MSEDGSRAQVVRITWESRLLFNSDREYQEALKITSDTVRSNADNTIKTTQYYNTLNRCCRDITDCDLDIIVSAYIRGSEMFQCLEWGHRKNGATRKKLCRMLFRLSSTGGLPLSEEEKEKFRYDRQNDEPLIRLFCPEGFENYPSLEILFVILFTYGVLEPRPERRMRSHDRDRSGVMKSLTRLYAMVEDFYEDTPRLGSMEKPFVFLQTMSTLKELMSVPEEMSEIVPLWILNVLCDIWAACMSLVIPAMMRERSEELITPRLPGIWVDDSDPERFWIFPENPAGAYCYRPSGNAGRELIPYEFNCFPATRPEDVENCFFCPPLYNKKMLVHPEKVTERTGLANPAVEMETDKAGDIIRLRFSEGPLGLPEWFDWREWTKLDQEDERYLRIKKELKDIYTPGNERAVLFTNSAPWLTDNFNALVARDEEYLYISDMRRPERFRMRDHGAGVFTYEYEYKGQAPGRSFLNMEISDQHPLYALPINGPGKESGNQLLRKFAMMLEDGINITTAYIIHDIARHPIIHLPSHAVSIELDEITIKELGIIIITNADWKIRQ